MAEEKTNWSQVVGAVSAIKCEIRWDQNAFTFDVYFYREINFDRMIIYRVDEHGWLQEEELPRGGSTPPERPLAIMRVGTEFLEPLRQKLNELFGPKIAIGAEGRIEAMREHIGDLRKILKIDKR